MSDRRDQQRAGRAVRARRGTLGWNQDELAAKAEVDSKTIWSLEKGLTWPIAKSRSRIEAALKWPNGEIERIAEGGGQGGAGEDRETAELLESVGTPEFDHKARTLIAALDEPQRSAVKALYEEYVDVQDRNTRLLDKLLVLLRPQSGHSGHPNGGRSVAG